MRLRKFVKVSWDDDATKQEIGVAEYGYFRSDQICYVGFLDKLKLFGWGRH